MSLCACITDLPSLCTRVDVSIQIKETRRAGLIRAYLCGNSLFCCFKARVKGKELRAVTVWCVVQRCLEETPRAKPQGLEMHPIS